MHKSVLLNECIFNLNISSSSKIVDCTLGYGGHSSEILKKIPNGFLIAFDQDKEAIDSSYKRLKEIGDNFKIVNSNFVNIKQELNNLGINKVDGILYDLGVSSPQLDEDYRGFSFHSNARLDMRMDSTKSLDAHYIVNNYDVNKLIKIFKEYGEEKYASSIANAIVKNRPINTTLELVDVIKKSVPFSYKKDKHPARKVFQAIRIEVNDELNVLEKSLNDALSLIDIKGRICVITFHSLEDKIVKDIFKNVSTIDSVFKNMPVVPDEYLPKFKVVKQLTPTEEEILNNSRSRSAKLRVIERVR